jgi:hypothetical protein
MAVTRRRRDRICFPVVRLLVSRHYSSFLIALREPNFSFLQPGMVIPWTR